MRTISIDSCSLFLTILKMAAWPECPLPETMSSSFTHLLWILAAGDLRYSVEGISIGVGLCSHLQMNDNFAPTRSHSWHHFCVFHCDTGCWNLGHTILIFLNTCVRTWENAPPDYLKSENLSKALIYWPRLLLMNVWSRNICFLYKYNF